MLDSPVRIFRCPICSENGLNPPLQDLSLLIEHIAKHYQFYLYECRECQARFATPFIANFHIREGICRHEDGDLRADGNEALIAVNLDDIEFSSFCTLQNAITKCTQDMLLEQKAAIEKDCKKNEREATMNTELPEEASAKETLSSPRSPSLPLDEGAAGQQAPCSSKDPLRGQRPKIPKEIPKNRPKTYSSHDYVGTEDPKDPRYGQKLKATIDSVFGEAPVRRYYRSPGGVRLTNRKSSFQKTLKDFKDSRASDRFGSDRVESTVYGSLNRDSQAVRVSSSPYTTRVIADGLHRRRVVRSELDDRPQKVRIRDDGASVIHRQESVERTTTDSWRTPRERRIDDGQLHAHGSAHLEPWDRRGADAPELIVRRSEMRNELFSPFGNTEKLTDRRPNLSPPRVARLPSLLDL
ncbi:hypothetical protein V3C99_019108 [Haemonchus contortus]|uniref:C2H2-type domain-containing protein n=1 Tax=Haemonchus contortus TaxID=6289 RepID=A0A7I4Z2N2_HAECO